MKRKIKILTISIISAFLLLSTVTIGSASINKRYYAVKSETKPVASMGLFDGHILNKTIEFLYNLSQKIQNITNIIQNITENLISPIIGIIDAFISALESIRDALIGNTTE